MCSQIIAYILPTVALFSPSIGISQDFGRHSEGTDHFLLTNRIMTSMIMQKHYRREGTFTIGHQHIGVHTGITGQIET